MQDKSKTQPKAFRITEDTHEKFKEIAQSLEYNQDQALAKLIEVYELEMGRTSIPEARENIDTFEGYMRAAINMYMTALNSNQNMRALVRTEFETSLKTKDQIIEGLHARTEEAERISRGAKEKEEGYLEKIKVLEDELSEANKKREKAEAEYAMQLIDIDMRFEELKSSNARLQASEQDTKTVLATFMSENGKLKEENDDLRKKNRELDVMVFEQGRENVQLTQELEQVQKELRDERRSRADEIGQYRKTVELQHRLELSEQENAIKTQYKAEIDELRKELDKYKDLYYQKEK